MATSLCLNTFREVTRGFLSAKEANEIFERVRSGERKKIAKELKSTANSINAYGMLDNVDAVNQTIDKIVEQQEAKALQQKRHALINMKVRRGIQTFLKDFKDPTEGLHAYLDGIESNIQNSRQSVALKGKTHFADFANRLNKDIMAADAEGLLEDNNFSAEIAQEVMAPGASKNAKIVALAKSVREIFKQSRTMLNKAGAEIAEEEGYMGRQMHDGNKMRSATGSFGKDIALRTKLVRQFGWKDAKKLFDEAAFKRWRDWIAPKLDMERTFEDVEDTEEFLRGVWDGGTTGVRLKPEAEGGFDPNMPFKRAANFAGKLGKERSIHFKDGASFVEYNEKFGSGSLSATIFGSLQKSADNLALLEGFGTNPKAMFEQITKEIRENAVRKDKTLSARQAQKGLNKTKNIFNHISGESNIPEDYLMARISSNLRVWESMAKLGGMAISSFSDFVNHAAMMRDHGVGLFEAYHRSFSGLGKYGNLDAANKELVSALGIYAKHMSGAMMASAHTADMPAGLMNKMMTTFFKYTGQEWLDRTNRISAATTISNIMAKRKGKAFSQLDARSKTTYGLYGIGEKEWDLMRVNTSKVVKGEEYITPDLAQLYSDESVAKYLGKDLKDLNPEEIQTVKNEMEDRLRGYFIDQVDHATLEAGATERRMLLGDTRPGTVAGEAMRFFAQFKQFPLTFMRRVLGKSIARKDWAGLTHIVLGATMFGYISRTTKQLLTGIQPENPMESVSRFTDVLAASFVQGGGAGIAGDFLFGQKSRSGADALVTTLGPVAGTFADVTNFLSSLKHWNNKDDIGTQFGKRGDMAFNLIRNNTPFLNLFYLRTALNYGLLYGLQETLSPGSLRHMERRIKKDNGQQFLFSPSQYSVKY